MARDPQGTLITRHAPIDRVFHWGTALAVLLLLGGLVPGLATAPWHWITGVLLCIAVVLHALRAAFSRSMRHMLIWPRHLREFWRGERAARHTLPQKLMHAVLGFAVLLACVTGVLLLTKAYLPGGQAGETIHSLHRVSAIAILVLSVVHIVYYLLPGKRAYLRAMIRGQMTRAEAAQFHDPARWSGQRKDDPRG